VIYPGATYRPLNQFSNASAHPRLGVVLHVNESDGPSLYNWIAGNNGMSCHFQVAKDGTVEQYIDTDNGSWCQVDGNNTYLSIETQGYHTEPLSDAQVHAIALLMSWVHQTHGIPLQLAEQPGQPGLIWHGAGGDSWGGHFDCPGDPRKAQRAQILALAGGTQEDDMTPDQAQQLKNVSDFVDAIGVHGTGSGASVINTTAIKVNAIAVRQAAQIDASGQVDVTALAHVLTTDLGPDLSKALVAAIGAALSNG